MRDNDLFILQAFLEYLMQLFISNNLTLIEAQPRIFNHLPHLFFLRLPHQNDLIPSPCTFLLESLPKLLQPHHGPEDICMNIPMNMKVFLRDDVANLYLQLGDLSEVFKVRFYLGQLP